MAGRVPEPALTLHGSAGSVSSVQPIENGPLGGHLISGSVQTFVYIWDLSSTRKLLTKFQCNVEAEKNSTVLWTHSSARQPEELLVQTREGGLHRWKLGECEPKFLTKTSAGNQLSFCPAVALDEHDLFCVPSGKISSQTSGVGIITQRDFKPVDLLLPNESTGLGCPMRMVQVTSNELLVAYESADLFLWDIRSPSKPVFISDVIKTSINMEKEEDATPLALDYDFEKGIVVVGSSSSAVKRFKLGPSEVSVVDSVTLPESGVTAVRIRPDRKILTVASWDFTARVFSWKTLKPLAVLDLHKETIQCVDYMKIDDDNCVVLGGKDAMISLWHVY